MSAAEVSQEVCGKRCAKRVTRQSKNSRGTTREQSITRLKSKWTLRSNRSVFLLCYFLSPVNRTQSSASVFLTGSSVTKQEKHKLFPLLKTAELTREVGTAVNKEGLPTPFKKKKIKKFRLNFVIQSP